MADQWGGTKIRIVVDLDGDGLIKLDSSAVDEIVTALKQDYDEDVVEEAKEFLLYEKKLAFMFYMMIPVKESLKMCFHGIFLSI